MRRASPLSPAVLLAMSLLLVSCPGTKQSQAKLKNETLHQQGTALYMSYCSSCHGNDGAGDGPAALVAVPKPRDFTSENWQNGANADRVRKVIKEGGVGVGLSSFMPPWQGILKDEEIEALVIKVKSFAPKKHQAQAVKELNSPALYNQFCSGCHGGNGLGDGPAVQQGLKALPPNFTDKAWQDRVTDDYIKRVIQYGGSANGKSNCMPAWGAGFNNRELDGLVKVVRGFEPSRYPRSGSPR